MCLETQGKKMWLPKCFAHRFLFICMHAMSDAVAPFCEQRQQQLQPQYILCSELYGSPRQTMHTRHGRVYFQLATRFSPDHVHSIY